MGSGSENFSYLKPPRGLYLALAGSAMVHLLLVGVLIMGGILRESRASQYQKARITALLRKGKPRPKHWLPRKPPAPAAAPAPKNVRTKKPDTKATRKARPKPRATDSRELERQMQQALASLGKQGGSKSDEEPEGSPEGVENGDALVAQKGQEYLTRLYKAIKAQYAVPEVIPPAERLLLRAVVVITIDARGNLKDFQFEKPSGNKLFDSAIEAAVRRASPFPPPPAELAEKYSSEGIGLEFTP
ncbi:MAG: cell envelope integrity protein TolA [Deltaproteobacteria bacterium]|nr:MAG: cell envelope integrity protein TolA [Deltaproteobacteria bacterium]